MVQLVLEMQDASGTGPQAKAICREMMTFTEAPTLRNAASSYNGDGGGSHVVWPSTNESPGRQPLKPVKERDLWRTMNPP